MSDTERQVCSLFTVAQAGAGHFWPDRGRNGRAIGRTNRQITGQETAARTLGLQPAIGEGGGGSGWLPAGDKEGGHRPSKAQLPTPRPLGSESFRPKSGAKFPMDPLYIYTMAGTF